GLSTLAQQHDVLTGEYGVLDLGDDRVVVADDAREKLFAVAHLGQEVLAHLLLDGENAILAATQLPDGRWSCPCHEARLLILVNESMGKTQQGRRGPARNRQVLGTDAAAGSRRPPRPVPLQYSPRVRGLRLRSHGKRRALRCWRALLWAMGGHTDHGSLVPTAVGAVFHATAVAGSLTPRS